MLLEKDKELLNEEIAVKIFGGSCYHPFDFNAPKGWHFFQNSKDVFPFDYLEKLPNFCDSNEYIEYLNNWLNAVGLMVETKKYPSGIVDRRDPQKYISQVSVYDYKYDPLTNRSSWELWLTRQEASLPEALCLLCLQVQDYLETDFKGVSVVNVFDYRKNLPKPENWNRNFFSYSFRQTLKDYVF